MGILRWKVLGTSTFIAPKNYGPGRQVLTVLYCIGRGTTRGVTVRRHIELMISYCHNKAFGLGINEETRDRLKQRKLRVFPRPRSKFQPQSPIPRGRLKQGN